jgi:nicotinate-nucleotide pyrophosphorylase (carboxylating)
MALTNRPEFVEDPGPLRPDRAPVREIVRRALDEDHARRDVTTDLLDWRGDRLAAGRFRAEAAMVVAGLPVAVQVFRELDPGCRVTHEVPEGSRAVAGDVLATVLAPARVLLAGERVALNFLQRLSGIAAATRAAVEAVRGTGAVITDTRKTTPGLRVLEKYAVRVGGGVNHRDSLTDAVLWKDNHWALLDGPGDRLADVLGRAPRGVPVLVEVETERQLEEALAAGVTRILVDNQPPERVAAWARRAGSGVAIEASGGITAETARAYAEAGARYLSIGSLTHSVRAAAVAFEVALVG